MNAPVRIVTTPERLRLRVEDYLLLDEAGAFADYTKTELIDGDIYVMNAQFSPHARAKSRLLRFIGNWLEEAGSELEAMSEVALRVADDSMPEPDVVVTSWRGGGAVPADTAPLVVEVAHTTLRMDLGRKAELYAAAGITEYWVVDLTADRVLVHDTAGPHGYRNRREVPLGDPLASVSIAGLTVDTARLID